MDVIQDSCIVSTGGNYGFIKDINHEDASSSCYYYADVEVRLTNTRTLHANMFRYEGNSFTLGTVNSLADTVRARVRDDSCF